MINFVEWVCNQFKDLQMSKTHYQMKLHKQQLLLWSFSRKYTRKGTNTNSPPLSIEPPRKKSYQIGKWNIHIFCCRVIQSNKSAFYFAKWTWTELNYAEHLVYTVRNMHGAQLQTVLPYGLDWQNGFGPSWPTLYTYPFHTKLYNNLAPALLFKNKKIAPEGGSSNFSPTPNLIFGGGVKSPCKISET